ncbi:MAG: capsular polysaccharide biosynthesis protein [Paracoccaceae bacterium]|nr:capsular polysaccharide biosynthesis protein [Paracoccaceae bacterium]
MRRILELAGWEVALGVPKPGDWVGIWGEAPTAPRGKAVAARTDAPILRVEDAFLRSVLPGRDGEPAMGLALDRSGVHFDAGAPSDLETLLATHPLDDPALLARARNAADRLRYWQISKYSCWDPALDPPPAPFVLVVDQTRGDAALPDDAAARFEDMLEAAKDEHPGRRIVIRTHPETVARHRRGHYGPEHAGGNVSLSTEPIAPGRLFEAAAAVYTMSSTLGLEAILAGHAPRVFGQPFYAGWGLTDDEDPVPRRTRHLTAEQLFAAAMILYPVWYDPFRDRLCELETVIDNLAARAVAWRQDRHGWVITNMSAWKRPHLGRMFGGWAPVEFRTNRIAARRLAERRGRPLMVWANDAGPPGEPATRIEDGFLRSPGLGAALVPPSSLGLDDEGIHFDPQGPSRLERLIAGSTALPRAEIERARRLRERIAALGLSKYNLREDLPPLPAKRPRVLVVGQVEDDAAVLRTRADPFGNADLLRAAREDNPDAAILYKTHPDVESGLRKGRVKDAATLADLVIARGDPARLLGEVDAVWTISSTLGFEALLRGVPVTCLGAPFYAGWGLTRDLGPVPSRRRPGPTLDGVVHAALIGYPRYFDPVTREPCPVEIAVDRLAAGIGFKPPGLLARLQRLRALVR